MIMPLRRGLSNRFAVTIAEPGEYAIAAGNRNNKAFYTQRRRWPTVAAPLSRRPNQHRALYNDAVITRSVIS